MGGVETGFMSTTTDWHVANDFATRGVSRSSDKCSMLFQIKMGMVDRGASVVWVSQFPTENEILFAPLTGLEVISEPWLEGSTIMISLRISTNTRDLTIDEVIGKMKRSHIDLIRYIIDDLQCTGVDDGTLLLPLTSLLQRQAERDAIEFNITANFSRWTEQLLEARKQVMQCISAPDAWAALVKTHGKDATVERMHKVITLEARAGEYTSAISLALAALQHKPLERKEREAVDAAVAKASKATGMRLEASELPRLEAASEMLFHHHTRLEPRMLVTLLGTLSKTAVGAFCRVMHELGLHKITPGSEVKVWREGRQPQCWESGVVVSASEHNMAFDVRIGGTTLTNLPHDIIRRVSEGGVGSLLFHSAGGLLRTSVRWPSLPPTACRLRLLLAYFPMAPPMPPPTASPRPLVRRRYARRRRRPPRRGHAQLRVRLSWLDATALRCPPQAPQGGASAARREGGGGGWQPRRREPVGARPACGLAPRAPRLLALRLGRRPPGRRRAPGRPLARRAHAATARRRPRGCGQGGRAARGARAQVGSDLPDCRLSADCRPSAATAEC